jgi:hypothetical protein
MRNIIILSLVMTTVMLSCTSGTRQGKEATAEESFMQNIHSYCGQQLVGEVIAESMRPELIGSPIYSGSIQCTDNEIRIQVIIPGEIQKTIILTLMGEEILLKHDVRNPDLSPANFTMYGGFSGNDGDEYRQLFPVHNFGQSMWPGFENYSWEISVQQSGNLEYTERTGNVVLKHYVLSLEDVN